MLKKVARLIYPNFNTNSNAIFLGILITNTSTFMLNAFLTIYMNNELGYSPRAIGFVLTVSLISQRGFTFFGGILSDRFGVKRLMIIGLMIRSIGYFSYLFAVEYYLLIFSSILVGGSGALLAPSLSTSIAVFSKDRRMDAFAYKGIIVSVASTIGPLIGTLIYSVSFESIFVITSLTHVFFIFIVARLSYDQPEKRMINQGNTFLKSFSIDKKLVLFTLMISFFWFLYVQLNLVIPLYISDFTNDESLIGMVYSLNGILVILFQYVLLNVLRKRMRTAYIICLGQFILGLSFGSLIVFTEVPFSLIVFCVLFSIGGMCVSPLIEEITVQMASEDKVATYIGFVSFGWAIGGTAGNMTGGWLYEFFFYQQTIRSLWAVYFIIGLFSSILLFYFMKRMFPEKSY